MIGLDLSGSVCKKWVKMRIKKHLTNNCVWYMLLYFVFYHILCIFLNSQLLTKMLNFLKFIKVTKKLGYLRWLNFVQEKSLWGQTSFLHAKWLLYFRMWWQNFPLKMWVMGRVNPRVIKTRLQDPLQMFWLIGHCWSQKMTDFWGTK